MRKLLSVLMLAAMPALAQVSNAPPLLNFKGTSPPANCVIGRLFFDTDATAGKNIYGCTSADTWTLQGDGTGTPGGSSGDLQYNNAGSFGGITPGSGVVTALGNATNAASGLVAYGGSAGALTLTTPTATSLAIGGATIGGNALAVTGTVAVSGAIIAPSISNTGVAVLDIPNATTNTRAMTFGTTGGIIYRNAGTGLWVLDATGARGIGVATSVGADLALGTVGTQFLSSPGTGILQLGKDDDASPVAQTLKAQGVASGTTNTAAPNLTYNAPVGTGTGTGGSHIFRVAPAHGSDSVQGVLAAALTIDSTKLATFGGGATFADSSNVTLGSASILLEGGGRWRFISTGLKLTTSTNLGIGWTGTTDSNNALTTNLSYISDGLLSIGTGAAGSFAGMLKLTALQGASNALRLGAAASATPAGQTFTIGESSRAATDLNTSGANGTIASGNGTGNAAVSSLLLQSPVAVGSGTGAQTLTTGATIQGGMLVLTGYAVASLPTGITGGIVHVTDQLTTCPAIGIAPTGGGSVKCVVFYNGSAWVGI